MLGELGERLHLEALVVVVNEDRQQAADVGVVNLNRPLRPGREVSLAAVLADQVHLVSERRQRRARLAL